GEPLTGEGAGPIPGAGPEEAFLRGKPPAIALKRGRRRAIFVVYWSPAREYGQRRTRALWAKPEGGAPWWQYL
ncbi:MAG TPA: hypothetical protein PLF51_00365, partial [Candidatus Hydrogenedentes bacterium]|nr:hypothetical protein [Candidatus Hydrogenedentota bacterium]